MQESLEDVLTQEVDCTQRLLACLDAERTALARRDMDALEKTTGEKLQRTVELERLDRQREQLLEQHGFATDAEGLMQCFMRLPRTDRLKALWQQILENLQACRDGNLTNGGILEAGRQHVEQALSILRGQSGAPALYKAGGDTAADLGQRDFGKV
jgi:flagellar biosynthesis/type III secretory pathway chaperone